MFSGLVETTTHVASVQHDAGGIRLILRRPDDFSDLTLGDSIAIQGCCLTLVDFDTQCMSFQAGQETLSKTTLGELGPGAPVNAERSLRLGDRIGGHLVTGHIDGTGRLRTRADRAAWCDMAFEAPLPLLRQMASKGSIAIDGVSLTLVEVGLQTFSVTLIPHTLQHTTLGTLAAGSAVNIETDLLAKYVQRQLQTSSFAEPDATAGGEPRPF